MSEGGKIELILGPMFSGKTSELLRRVTRYGFAGRRCIVIKYAKDTRYSVTKASTHNNLQCEAIGCNKLSEFSQSMESFDVLAIDEGQFFPDAPAFCEEMANRGKIVIVAALDSTFQRAPFGCVLNLVSLAEKVTKLSAVCTKCGQDAGFTKRLSDDLTTLELIGGPELYAARCRPCYFAEEENAAQAAIK